MNDERMMDAQGMMHQNKRFPRSRVGARLLWLAGISLGAAVFGAVPWACGFERGYQRGLLGLACFVVVCASTMLLVLAQDGTGWRGRHQRHWLLHMLVPGLVIWGLQTGWGDWSLWACLAGGVLYTVWESWWNRRRARKAMVQVTADMVRARLKERSTVRQVFVPEDDDE
jgi:hypothetical protein